MIKKIIMIMMLFTILMGGIQSCLATDTKNVELNIKGETTIKEDAKTVELILSLGEFIGVEENVPFGYEGKLEYDKDMFASKLFFNIRYLRSFTISFIFTCPSFVMSPVTIKVYLFPVFVSKISPVAIVSLSNKVFSPLIIVYGSLLPNFCMNSVFFVLPEIFFIVSLSI